MLEGLEGLPIDRLPVPRMFELPDLAYGGSLQARHPVLASRGEGTSAIAKYVLTVAISKAIKSGANWSTQSLEEGHAAAALASAVPPVQCPPIDIQQLSHYLHSMRDSTEAMIPAVRIAPLTVVIFFLQLRSMVRHIASPYEPIRKRRSCIFGLIGLGAFGDLAATGDPLLLDLLRCPDVIVSDLTACVIAIISCEAIGRWFMAAESGVLIQLVHNMLQAPYDSPAFMHSLAALQRLSMRYHAQTIMLRENLVEEMMTRIEQGTMSRFGVRWGLALILVSLIASDDNIICESTYELIGYLLVGAPSETSRKMAS
ncbi:hypothetical protein Pmar_PMAR002857 [Perkinsus marinus ATCC 50983]|uniref:Uncharacterized protein n=1 Tax=Perkinsus marinus (strain ATCC 50983 / TXsc) TaxID=423536 RepID=C5LQQ7_PERM5|nr:hypothetical protein Pmar_PMAR002857 [Perkinsus marinus ATCC 50983]EER00792.1 hypothetical protein Pmar_PMAR002857 [Perkinsus marinus ATCC 50983]|eukprot:XP_002768074.1 hypothetical protein Pmar_PMAR002857 [Perkinsus marinus ATCC 50983]